jgi:peroxiredoxin Q/BCP
MAADVGSPAPSFTLPSTEGETSLEAYRGQVVVLVFYPGDDTAVCTKQLTTYNDDLSSFEGLGAQLLAISPQSVESHERFSGKQGGFRFPMLADEDKAVFQAYGCVGPLGFARRCIFVIDARGIVRYAHRSLTNITFRSSEELLEAIKSAG